MSHAATNWAIRQKGLKPATKLVLWHLCDRHNPDHGCFPTQTKLAADCEMSRSSLNEHLDKLEASGLIRRVRSIDGSTRQQRPTRYILAFEGDNDGGSENRTLTVKTRDRKPDTNRDRKPDTNRDRKPDTNRDRKPDTNRVLKPDTAENPVSEKTAIPCPDFANSRVQILDTNLVRREPVREPVSCRAAFSQPDNADQPESNPDDRPPPRPADNPPPKARLPADWALADAGWAYARSQQIPDEVTEDEARGFHAYWTDRRDRDGSKSARGWATCWEGWCRRIAVRYRRVAGPANSGGYGQGSSMASIAARRRAAGQV